MYNLKLCYFDFHGGRGEPARLAMHLGGIEFEDIRFPVSQFGEVKNTTPLGQVPTLTVNGKQITQCNAINRFVGKLSKLYPDDIYQALLCDEIMDATEDVISKIVATFSLEGEEQELARKDLINGSIADYLGWLQTKLEQQGGKYFIENRLTIADLRVFVWAKTLLSGNLDHIPASLIKESYPKIYQHFRRISEEPELIEYYAKY